MKLSTITAILLLGATSLLAEAPAPDEYNMSEEEMQMMQDEIDAKITREALVQQKEAEEDLIVSPADSGDIQPDYTENSLYTYFGTNTGGTSTASYNAFFGSNVGINNTSGTKNTFVGHLSGVTNKTGQYNTFVGHQSGYKSTSNYNTFVGELSGWNTAGGSQNVYIGTSAGYRNISGYNNISIGDDAGYYETGSNKLYIEPTASSAPLIYGDFYTNLVRVNGKSETIWSGSNTVGDGMTEVFKAEATNSASGKSSDPGFILRNGLAGKQWNFRTTRGGQGFAATINGTSGLEFEVVNTTSNYSGVNLYLGSGASCVNGVWTNTSSRASKENIKILSSEDALQAFHQLQPVTYNYKTDKTESYAGFIAEDVPELVAVNGRDGLSAMDMVAVLTKVVQEQDRKITELEAKQEEITILKKRVASLELLLTNLALNTDGAKKEKVSMK